MITAFTMLLLLLVTAGLIALGAYLFQQIEHRKDEARNSGSPTSGKAKAFVISTILSVAAASVLYRWLVSHHLEQTSALFIGVPTLLAIIVVLTGRPKSATGSLCMVTAVALLISGIFLGEGFICIVMAAPIFFGIAVLIGVLIDVANRRKKSETTMSCLLLLIMIPMSMEGVRPQLSFPREETVVAERVLRATATEITANLAGAPDFSRPLPPYLRLGFPQPTGISGAGLRIGDRRLIRFEGGEGKPGELELEVAQSSPERVLFRAESDTSHIAHWLSWRSAEVQWWQESEGNTRVRWTLRYRRSLDPAWYFGPWERYAVRLAGEYLIASTTPDRRN